MLGLCCYGRPTVVSLRLQIAVASAFSILAVFASPAAAIVGGTTAGSSSWPWAVQVFLVGSGGVEGFCGGTLVAPTRVVTSGSCTTSGADLVVLANSKKFGDEGAQAINVTDFERAPSWASATATDVAVLTLAEAPDPATPIALLSAEESADFPAPAAALVAGWGATDPSSSDPGLLLQQTQVTLAGCGETGVRCSEGATGPCFGDVGDPVIVQLGADTVSKDPSPENGAWRLVAIPVAGSEECDVGIYADLTEPGMRAFVEGSTDGEQPGSGGGASGPAPSSPPPAASSALPPQTKLLKAQIDARKGSASFRFKGSGNLKGFQCALASGKRKKPKFRSCRSPKSYRNLAPGSYTFKVRAVGPGGPDATPAKKRFTIG